MTEYEEKKRKLKKQMRSYAKEKCMVAFSGGVDSSLLLKLACEAEVAEKDTVKKTACESGSTEEDIVKNAVRGSKHVNENIYAVTMQTQLHPVREIEHAAKVAEEIGAVHFVIPVDELMEAGIDRNPQDRCYRCKKHLFTKMQEKASALGIPTILEGTNADDLQVFRPGLKAIRELGVISPLADAGFTKADVRRLAGEYQLSVSNRPAVPCLATRFPYGTTLSYEEMQKVEQGEEFLKSFGLYNVRLRIHHDIARIEADFEGFPVLLQNRENVISYMKELGYSYVTLDLEGFRSGSMDIGMKY